MKILCVQFVQLFHFLYKRNPIGAVNGYTYFCVEAISNFRRTTIIAKQFLLAPVCLSIRLGAVVFYMLHLIQHFPVTYELYIFYVPAN